METLFSNFASIIVFLHVVSAVIWVGGMIAIRFAIHHSMQEIDDPKIRLGRTLENLRRFFNMVIPAIILLLLTAIIMIVALKFKGTPLYSFVIAKEAIWTIMAIVFIIIYIKRNQAQKLLMRGSSNCKRETSSNCNLSHPYKYSFRFNCNFSRDYSKRLLKIIYLTFRFI